MGLFSNLKQKAKNAAVSAMLKKQMGNLPKEQQEMIMNLIEENPEFFENIAKEIEAKVKSGKSQLAAGMEVMRKYQSELQNLLMKSMGGDPRKKDRNLR